nr:putative inositol transporter 2 [Quercus suber]
MIIAALIGSVASGFINHKKSARCSLLLTDLINFFGSMFILMKGVSFVPQIGQITICLGSGISLMSIPLYIKEESSSKLSDGIIIFSSFIMIMGPAVHYYLKIMYTDQVATTCLTVILPVIHFCGLYYLDLSPRDFMIQGKQVHALRAIERRYLDNEVAYQFTQLKNQYHVKRSGSSSSLKSIRNGKTLSSLIKGLVPIIVSQLLGHQLVIHSIKGCLEKTEIRKEFEFMSSVFVVGFDAIPELFNVKIYNEEDLCFGGAAASFVNNLLNGLTILILFKDGEKNIDIKRAFAWYQPDIVVDSCHLIIHVA